jgi:hypothetical protein
MVSAFSPTWTMSFVQAGDIIRALEFLRWIYDNGFVRENSAGMNQNSNSIMSSWLTLRADVRYENFRSDVQDFDAVLQDLKIALDNAAERYRTRGTNSALNPRDAAFESERRRLIGAFDITLEDCKNVLLHKIEPKRNAQGVLQSLRWAAGAEDTVNRLRGRLQFHMQKMLLVVNRLSLRLMTDSADTLDDILGLCEQSIVLHGRTYALLQQCFTLLAAHLQGRALPNWLATEDLPPIPQVLDQTFQRLLLSNAPANFAQTQHDIRELPIEEGFDALMTHFGKSAESSTGSQTPEHYVQLLKAVWLVQKLKASQDYQNARPGYYYRRAIVQIEQQLSARLQAPRLLTFDAAMLSELPDHTYEIWPSPEPFEWVSQADPKPSEHEEIRLDLALQGNFAQQEIIVFRKSEHAFRIVQENTGERNGQIERQQISMQFDFTRDNFIPFYAIPPGGVRNEVAFSNIHTGDLESYRFRTSGDLYKFQEIILGHRMVAEDKNVTFEFSNGVKGRGRMQIWQDPPDRDSGSVQYGSSSSSSARSPHSLHNSRIGSAMGSITPSTITEHREGAESGTVPLPSLVIFTELENKLAFIYIKLDQGLRIIREHCGCRYGDIGYARCCSLSLAREDHRGRVHSFPTHTLVAKTDSMGRSVVSTYDLSVFRLPTHPRFHDLQKKKAEYLYMTFDSPQLKDEFNVELHDRFKLRDKLIQQLRRYDDDMQYQAERPETLRGTIAPPPNPLLRGLPSRAPSIGSLHMGRDFGDEVARSTDPSRQTLSSAPCSNAESQMSTISQTTMLGPVHSFYTSPSGPEPWLARTDNGITIPPTTRPPDRCGNVTSTSDEVSTRSSISSRIGKIFLRSQR